MGYIRNLFAKATEIDRLQGRCDYLQSCLDREIWKNQHLDEQIVAERKAKDKFVLRYADQISRQAKLPEHFVDDVTPKEAPKPEPLTMAEEEKVRWAAIELRNADIDSGRDAPPLETYINAIKEDPNSVFIG